MLVRQGFTILEANEAFELISACAMGSAIAVRRERALARTSPRTPSPGLPYLHQLQEALATAGPEPFQARLATVIRAIALRNGLDLAPVDAALEGNGHESRA